MHVSKITLPVALYKVLLSFSCGLCRSCVTCVCSGLKETFQSIWGSSRRLRRELRRNFYCLMNNRKTSSTWIKNRCLHTRQCFHVFSVFSWKPDSVQKQSYYRFSLSILFESPQTSSVSQLSVRMSLHVFVYCRLIFRLNTQEDSSSMPDNASHSLLR